MRVYRSRTWMRIAKEMGLNYATSKFSVCGEISFKTLDSDILIDVFLDDSPILEHRSRTSTTRVRANIESKDDFSCEVYPASLGSNLKKIFGMQDILIGHKDIDDLFIFKTNNKSKLCKVFEKDEIRNLLSTFSKIHISITNNKHFLGSFHPKPRNSIKISIAEIVNSDVRLKTIITATYKLIAALDYYNEYTLDTS